MKQMSLQTDSLKVHGCQQSPKQRKTQHMYIYIKCFILAATTVYTLLICNTYTMYVHRQVCTYTYALYVHNMNTVCTYMLLWKTLHTKHMSNSGEDATQYTHVQQRRNCCGPDIR